MDLRHGLACSCLIFVTGVAAFGDDPLTSFAGKIAAFDDAPIVVDIKLARYSAATQEEPKTGQQKLAWAVVEAGGSRIELDWSKSVLAERELTRNATANHGDLREQRLNVRGTLEFRLQKSSGRDKGKPPAVAPVIVVETLSIDLIHAHEVERARKNRGLDLKIR